MGIFSKKNDVYKIATDYYGKFLPGYTVMGDNNYGKALKIISKMVKEGKHDDAIGYVNDQLTKIKSQIGDNKNGSWKYADERQREVMKIIERRKKIGK